MNGDALEQAPGDAVPWSIHVLDEFTQLRFGGARVDMPRTEALAMAHGIMAGYGVVYGSEVEQ